MTSSWSASTAEGSDRSNEKISARFSMLPHASSPITKRWQTTLPASSNASSSACPRRRCSTQSDVSARTTYASPLRRLGIAFRRFSLPPNLASLLALSAAMSASNPNRTRNVFSVMPVNRDALSIKLSSMFNVVRIKASPRCIFVCLYMYLLYAVVNTETPLVQANSKPAIGISSGPRPHSDL